MFVLKGVALYVQWQQNNGESELDPAVHLNREPWPAKTVEWSVYSEHYPWPCHATVQLRSSDLWWCPNKIIRGSRIKFYSDVMKQCNWTDRYWGMCRRRSSVGVAADYADVLVRWMDQLRAHPRMASTDRRAYAVNHKFRMEQQSVWTPRFW